MGRQACPISRPPPATSRTHDDDDDDNARVSPSFALLRSPSFASNVFATLLNLAPHMRDVHEYAAHRLVVTTCSVLRRFTHLCDLEVGSLGMTACRITIISSLHNEA